MDLNKIAVIQRDAAKGWIVTTATAKSTKIPVFKGCSNRSQCFCTGACKEVIGYRDKLPLEM